MAEVKFQRRYRITIQSSDGAAIVIDKDLTAVFNIHRSVSSSLNMMTLEIYNLSAATRSQIFQDRFSTRRYKIIVELGYSALSTVFVGDIYEANSTRQGTNIITTIDARDGNFDTSQTIVNTTFKEGSTIYDIIDFMARAFPNVSIRHITHNELDGVFERPVVLEGNVYELIKQYSNSKLNQVYIDLGVINVLGQNEVIVNSNLTLIDASTGMINTPRRDQSFLTVTTLLEPRVVMGQIVEVNSKIQPQYNGVYKVLGVTHRGIISSTQNGDFLSVFEMNGNQLVGGFTQV